jgi:archaellin
MSRARRLLRRLASQSGISALEMILIGSGFLVVASAFGGVVLTTGLTSSGQVEQTLNDALARTGNGLELRGPVIAITDGEEANAVSVDVALAIGGDTGVNLDHAALIDRTVVSFIDDAIVVRDLPYTVDWTVGDGDATLERGELAALLIDVSAIDPPLTSGRRFLIEVRPPNGTYLTIRRTMPHGTHLDTIINLQ